MKQLRYFWLILLLALGGISPFTVARQTQAQEEPLYVAIVWHHHQPVYLKDSATGVYNRPWVRVHATKNYLDMASTAANYPDVHLTFNITASLIRQLNDFANGAKDLYWVLAEVPAEALSAEQKQFIAERFFDTNRRIIAEFPRYQELLESRDSLGIAGAVESWTAADWRDLQVLFNLAWTDPDWLGQEPLASIAAKERDFAEEDKAILFAEHLRLIREVLPYYAQLQENGQVEITMTPFAHPILPLLVDSNEAALAMPDAELPPRFFFEEDAIAQVQLGLQLYEESFGTMPHGMWPAEGAVSSDVIQMIADAGIEWIATDEEILGNSLPDLPGFTRNSDDTVQQANALYRPYTVTGEDGGELAIIFRDKLISLKVGFEFSEPPGEQAAQDFIARLENIRSQLQAEGAEGPHLVTILVDGENPWEYYANDGKAFLNGIYSALAASDTLQTVTPSEFLALAPEPRPLDNLWSGSWINPTYDTWIGEAEENLAWDYLRRTRMDVRSALPDLDAATADAVMTLMYSAEGSDWFWWYGDDQTAQGGNDADFDRQFRGFLRQIYALMGAEIPQFVEVPIVVQVVEPNSLQSELLTVSADGTIAEGEWAVAASYDLGEVQADLTGLHYGFDEESFSLRLDSSSLNPDATYGFYFQVPDNDPANAFVRGQPATEENLIGFGAKRLLELRFQEGEATAQFYIATRDGDWREAPSTLITLAAGEDGLEIVLPRSVLSPAAGGSDSLYMRLFVADASGEVVALPADGAAVARVPEVGVPNVVLAVEDPTGDDNGPGTYVYPDNALFRPGVFDATSLTVGSDEENIIFQMSIAGPFVNDWGSPNGMGVLTVDFYIDQDGPANGMRLLLPGRNAVTPEDYAWDYAVFVEGWESALYQASPDGAVKLSTPIDIDTNPATQTLTVKVPRSALTGDPATWAYAAITASQDGFPAPGVLRIRNVGATAEEWLIGGGQDGASNQPRILDVVWAAENSPSQAELLGDFQPSEAAPDSLSPEDFGQVPLMPAGGS